MLVPVSIFLLEIAAKVMAHYLYYSVALKSVIPRMLNVGLQHRSADSEGMSCFVAKIYISRSMWVHPTNFPKNSEL